MVDSIIFIFITILGVSLGFKVISTQNPVYSGLYLVLLFFLGSAISFLLGLEFMALLFLLVYAGAIAVLVLFVVMMLDVKAIENPWSVGKKRLFYSCLFFLVLIASYEDLFMLFRVWATNIISLLISFSLDSYSEKIEGSILELYQVDILEFFSLWLYKENINNSFKGINIWFVGFDSSCSLNDLSYLLYSTHAILLIIAGIVLLIAMVGAISLTLQKNCPESLYKQLGHESKNAVFTIKQKSIKGSFVISNLGVSDKND